MAFFGDGFEAVVEVEVLPVGYLGTGDLWGRLRGCVVIFCGSFWVYVVDVWLRNRMTG